GPVVYDLYDQHRGRYNLQRDDIEGDAAVLDKDERESIDVVLEIFRAYSAHELSAMTHQAGPWLDARRRAGVDDLQRS
ncbi:DUF4065 domain-containing protein, partial [Streptomyces sp. A73]|nr:DUF4065 domain-containing protein [Streptomyces sp. A73]